MIESALSAVRHRMEAAMVRAGRVDRVRLVGVTKNHPVEAVEEAAALGVAIVGENRVQEAKQKIEAYQGPPIEWHLIGHLQVNKVRQAVPLFSLIHSVDSRKVLDEIERVAAKHEKVQDVLLQLNIACEASKSGMLLEEYPALREYAQTLPHVRVRGLMCMAPFFENAEESRPIFRVAAALYEDMKQYFPPEQISYLSMGMTHDFEVAIEEGANLIRVGTAIFGERIYK